MIIAEDQYLKIKIKLKNKIKTLKIIHKQLKKKEYNA